MQLRHGGGHVRIAFVGADDDFPSLGDSEIRSRQTCICGKEFVAEAFSGAICKVCRVVIIFFAAQLLFKQLPHLILSQVNCRHDYMARLLVQQLDNPLSKIGLDHFDPVLFKIRVHLAFLSQHRLGFHQFTDIVGEEYIQDYGVEFLCILGPMHLDTVCDSVCLEPFKISVQMSQGMHLDLGCLLTEGLPFIKALSHVVSLCADSPEGIVLPAGLLTILEKSFRRLRVCCTHSPDARISTT